MSNKVIAIGNVLMGDDGIGVIVTEKIRDELEKMGLEVIIGETDVNYCISSINREDLIFIIDAADCNCRTGEIGVFTIKNFNTLKKGHTQHSFGVLELLKIYFPELNGYIIAIQIYNTSFKLGISNVLEENIEEIGKQIVNIIRNLL